MEKPLKRRERKQMWYIKGILVATSRDKMKPFIGKLFYRKVSFI